MTEPATTTEPSRASAPPAAAAPAAAARQADAVQQRSAGRWGPLFASIWLFFLIDPAREAVDRLPSSQGMIGLVATLAFAATYLGFWMVNQRRRRTRLVMAVPLADSLPWVAGLVVLATVMVATLGEVGLTAVVYIAVSTVIALPLRVAAAAVVTLVVGVAIAGEAVPGWDSMLGLAFATMAASMAVFGIRMMITRNIELVQAHQTNAALAVENERNRLARDLHDILGHSLTVITVKAELAGRLIDADPARAKAEIGDLERLSRDALADVRRAVEGYRELSLPGELARARAALTTAAIDAELPNSTDDVPSELRELFAWTVREGVTNVIRHSAAQHCRVVLTSSSVEIADDGRGPTEGEPGNGLIGLRERASSAGATVVTRSLAPGFSLKVVVR